MPTPRVCKLCPLDRCPVPTCLRLAADLPPIYLRSGGPVLNTSGGSTACCAGAGAQVCFVSPSSLATTPTYTCPCMAFQLTLTPGVCANQAAYLYSTPDLPCPTQFPLPVGCCHRNQTRPGPKLGVIAR